MSEEYEKDLEDNIKTMMKDKEKLENTKLYNHILTMRRSIFLVII